METKQQAIARATAYLRAAGCTYHIKDSDGNDVINTIPQKITPTQRRKYVGYKRHYSPIIKAVDDGQNSFAVTIQVPEEFDVAKYRGALSASMSTAYGRANHISHINRKERTVELMVVRPSEM